MSIAVRKAAVSAGLLLFVLIAAPLAGMLQSEHLPRHSVSTRLDPDKNVNNFIPDVVTNLYPPQPNPVMNDGLHYTLLRVGTSDQDLDHGSNVTSVTVDLTSFGLSVMPLYDDGMFGDVTPYDHVFSYNLTVSMSIAPGIYVFAVNATDNGTVPSALYNNTQNITLTVEQYNRAPELRVGPVSEVDMVEDGPGAYVLLNDTVFVDADLAGGFPETLTFMVLDGAAWVTHYSDPNLTIDISPDGNATFNSTQNSNGNFQFTFNVTDIKGHSLTHNISVNIAPENDKPALNYTSNDLTQVAYQDEWLNRTFSGWDPVDRQSVTFSATLLGPIASLPLGFMFYPNGTLSFLPTNDDVGSFWVNISVTDGALSDWANFTFNVVNMNDRPVFVTVAGQAVTGAAILIEATEDVYENFTVAVADPDLKYGDVLTYTLNITNARIWINETSGNVSFLPSNDDVGYVNGSMTVKDNADASDVVDLSIHILNVNDPPVAQPINVFVNDSNPSTVEKENRTVGLCTGPATDVDIGDSITYIWSFGDGGMLPGKDLLYVEHTYAQGGNYTVTLTVKDNALAENSTSILIRVYDFVPHASEYNYTADELKRAYSDDANDVMSYSDLKDRVFIEKDVQRGIDLQGLVCAKDGNYLRIYLNFTQTPSDKASIYIYFVKPDHIEPQLPGSATALPGSYVPSGFLYDLKTNSVSFVSGEKGAGGLTYEVTANGSSLMFNVLLADMEKKGAIGKDFELFAISEILNGSYYARDTIGKGAAAPPAINNIIPSGGNGKDKGLFGLGKIGPVDVFYIIVGAAVLIIIVIVIVILMSRKKRAQEEETDSFGATPQGAASSPDFTGTHVSSQGRYVVTPDMYADNYRPPSPNLPDQISGAHPSHFDTYGLVQQSTQQRPPAAPSVYANAASQDLKPLSNLPPLKSAPDMNPPLMAPTQAPAATSAPPAPAPSAPVPVQSPTVVAAWPAEPRKTLEPQPAAAEHDPDEAYPDLGPGPAPARPGPEAVASPVAEEAWPDEVPQGKKFKEVDSWEMPTVPKGPAADPIPELKPVE